MFHDLIRETRRERSRRRGEEEKKRRGEKNLGELFFPGDEVCLLFDLGSFLELDESCENDDQRSKRIDHGR